MKEAVTEKRKSRLRTRAEDMPGDNFDIYEFHNRLLEHGGVTSPMIGANFEFWIVDSQEQNAKLRSNFVDNLQGFQHASI
jgi:hypothetical protein